MKRKRPIESFVSMLSNERPGGNVVNQYSTLEGDLRGNAVRRRNLTLYLREMSTRAPAILLVGEAVSHRGGRLTGIAFVSETLMLRGVEATSGAMALGSSRGYIQASDGPPSTEASATMVWETIARIEPLPLLWNAFPFHPFQAGNQKSNRAPNAAERLTGQTFLKQFLGLFPSLNRIVAVGNQASSALTALSISHVKVRHPSQGGKPRFVAGMREISRR